MVFLLLAAAATGALASEEALPWIQVESAVHGFSFFYPPNWTPKTLAGDSALFRFADEEGGCSVLAADLEPSATPVSDQENLPRLTAAFAPELLQPDPSIQFVSFRTEELQGLHGLNVVFDRPSRDVAGLVTREKFAAVARGDQGFAVRCVAPRPRFDDLQGTFDGVIASMRWKEPTVGEAAPAAPPSPSVAMASPAAPSDTPMRVAAWLVIYTVCALLLAFVAKRRNRSPWAWGLLGALAGPLSFVVLLLKPPLSPTEAEVTGETEVRGATSSPLDGAPTEPRPPDFLTLAATEPVGIGGWLVLPLFGLVMTIAGSAKSLLVDILPALGPETLSQLMSPESFGHSILWVPYLLGSALFSLVLFAGAIALLFLFVKRKASLPLFFSIFYGFGAAVAAFELLGVHALAKEFPDLFEAGAISGAGLGLARALASAAIWIAYFRVSRRVKNTFVVP